MDEIVEEDPMKKVTSWLLLLSLVTLLLPAFAVAEGTVTLEWFMDYAAQQVESGRTGFCRNYAGYGRSVQLQYAR